MKTIVSCQMYPWYQVYNDGLKKNWEDHLDDILAQVAQAGVAAWEQSIESEAQAARLEPLLRKHGLELPSIYVGGGFHGPEWEASVERGVKQATWARALGARIVACNPNPVDWGTKQNKSDAELRTQARALEAFGQRLKEVGMKLAYHTHDPEMRAGARELHHMLAGTNPGLVGFCLDTHWIYRGAENSVVAVEDLIALYGSRIHSLHIRQSRNQVWTETFGEGDIDYASLAPRILATGFSGPIVIEQAREAGTPSTLPPGESLRRGRAAVKQYFGV